MRLQLTISDEAVERIDKYAKMLGISRSALCTTWIGQGLMGYDKANEMINTEMLKGLDKITETK